MHQRAKTIRSKTMMNYSLLLNRLLGGACGMGAGFVCGMHANDEFLTFALGTLGAFLGMTLGFMRSFVLSVIVAAVTTLIML